MASRTIRFLKAARRAATRAKLFATPVLKAAARAAVIAAVATGITAALAERKGRKLPAGRRPKA